MAATGTLIPAIIDMTVIVGSDFTATVTFYQDTARTSPFDLAGYAVEIDIGGLLTLTIGSGLTVATPANGVVVMTLTHAQTAVLVPGTVQHYWTKLTGGTGTISYPLSGTLYLDAP